jgi:aspartyl-tRNA(Asn)/glutamyl-tRNA(Gln) amidotransferase subunit A
VITLKEALCLSKEELSKFCEELKEKIQQNSNIGAYVEQFTNEDLQLSLQVVFQSLSKQISM